MTAARGERRRFRRFEVRGLSGSLLVPVKIRLVNLSVGGMALETHSYLRFGRSYTVKLEGDERGLTLAGTVAWCTLKSTARSDHGEVLPLYRAGLKFEALDAVRGRELWELIRSHAVVEVEDSVLGRFRVNLSRGAALGSSYDFAVRKLSRSGMLIETDFVPEVGSSFELQLSLGGSRWRSRARVASVPRSGRRALGELTQVGVEFCDLGSDEAGRLRDYIEDHLERSTQR
jgi:Tfp pilus assembly protein PilZ